MLIVVSEEKKPEKPRITLRTRHEQECIPVGCVPSAAVAVLGVGWGDGGGLSARGRGCLPRGLSVGGAWSFKN